MEKQSLLINSKYGSKKCDSWPKNETLACCLFLTIFFFGIASIVVMIFFGVDFFMVVEADCYDIKILSYNSSWVGPGLNTKTCNSNPFENGSNDFSFCSSYLVNLSETCTYWIDGYQTTVPNETTSFTLNGYGKSIGLSDDESSNCGSNTTLYDGFGALFKTLNVECSYHSKIYVNHIVFGSLCLIAIIVITILLFVLGISYNTQK